MRNRPCNQAPQSDAHVKAKFLLPWFTKFCFKTGIFECVWPPRVRESNSRWVQAMAASSFEAMKGEY